MERHKVRPRSIISMDSGYKPKRLLTVCQSEMFDGEIMTSTRADDQRYYYSSSDGEDSRSNDCFYGSNLFEADHGSTPVGNFCRSPAPRGDRRRPSRDDWHPCVGPTWPPSLRTTQPGTTGDRPQRSSTGGPPVPPQQPCTSGPGRNYEFGFAGQSPFSHTVWMQGSVTAPLQGSSGPKMNSQVRHRWRSYECGEKINSPHVYMFEDGPYSPSESSQELQRRRWHEQSKRCITPRHVEYVSSSRNESDSGRRRRHRTHSSRSSDDDYLEPCNLQRCPYRAKDENNRRRRREYARRLGTPGTRRRSESATRLCRHCTTRGRSDYKAREDNVSGPGLRTCVGLANQDRRIVDSSAARGGVTQVRSRTGIQVRTDSSRWAHRQVQEHSETTEPCASAELRMRKEGYRTLAPDRTECTFQVVNENSLFCGATSKHVSEKKHTDVRYPKKRKAHVGLSHNSSRRLASVVTRSGQWKTPHREITPGQVEVEPDLTSGSTHILQHASPSNENQLQGYSLGPVALGTLFACADSKRLFQEGAPSQFSQEVDTTGIRRSETAVLTEVVNAGDILGPEDFGDCHSDIPVQPSSSDRDTYVKLQHFSGDRECKLIAPDPCVNDKETIGTGDKVIGTVVDVAAERTSYSEREAPFVDALATFCGPARDVKSVVNQWLQTSFPDDDSACSMHGVDEQQNKHSFDPFAETPEDPCPPAAAASRDLSFWNRGTVSVASTNSRTTELSCERATVPAASAGAPPTMDLSFWERDTVSFASTSSGDDGDVIVVSEHMPFDERCPSSVPHASPHFQG